LLLYLVSGCEKDALCEFEREEVCWEAVNLERFFDAVREFLVLDCRAETLTARGFRRARPI
jgi:hypothetical protein